MSLKATSWLSITIFANILVISQQLWAVTACDELFALRVQRDDLARQKEEQIFPANAETLAKSEIESLYQKSTATKDVPTIVLIHGPAESKEHFKELAELLLPNFNVLT